MSNVFISHAEEDAHVVKAMAAAFEGSGYSTWYFERDTLPGVPYLNQVVDAIDGADAFLLLISSHSLDSYEVSKEIELAHGTQRRFLPVFLDVTRDEMRHRQPSWRAAIGGAAEVSISDDGVSSLVARITCSLEHWQIPPTGIETQATLPLPRRVKPKRGIWASDANQIDIGDLESIVFRNHVIEDFLSNEGKFFLSANKGLGKTLLLTYKRTMLDRSHREHKKKNARLYLVPEGRPYLDFMSDLKTIRRSYEHFLSELKNAKRLWACALRVSAISHHDGIVTDQDAGDLAHFPERFGKWLLGDKTEATVVFKELLNCSLSDANRVLDETENFLEHKFRRVHSGTLIFVDKVDQSLRYLSRQAWIAVQAGLIEAAWDAMSANNHVKIYASIRQEAFANYESDIKANLFGATTVISYCQAELQRLLDQLARCYEGGRTFKEFTGLNAVRTPHHAIPEDSFDYVCRHTLGRPRDLVIVASELSARQHDLTEPEFRRIADETSARVLVSNVFEEMRVFLDCLSDRTQRMNFLSLLPHNILGREAVIRIWHQFNGVDADCGEPFDRSSPGMHHPFWELYCAGLLGVVSHSAEGSGMIQRFKQPSDLIDDTQDGLPDVPFYLIHPALEAYIRNRWATGRFRVFCHMTVGHGYPWQDFYPLLYEVEKTLFSMSPTSLRNLGHVVLEELITLLDQGSRDGIHDVMEGSTNWHRFRLQLAESSHEDALLWYEELITSGRTRTLT